MSPVPRGERLVIALIGKRNAGKSSLINAIVGQEIAIVSEVAGTTTDPVAKHYELLPLGPVTFFDTAGVDDVGDLGEKRIQSTKKILYRADIVLFVNPGTAFGTHELEMLQRIGKMEVPLLMIFNKSDIAQAPQSNIDYCAEHDISHISVSCKTMEGILQTKEALIRMAPKYLMENRVLAGDLVDRRDRVILVCPIDSAAPKGRLILPQVQVIRDLLDHDAIPVVVKETELISSLEMLKEPPRLVITDSQAIEQVDRETPENIALTTFSILFARYKGELDTLLDGIRQIDKLRDGDRVLIAEACSHHVQKDDIGRVKIPRWLTQSTGKNLTFEVFAGHDFPENLEDYALCIHCGGCMINTMEMNRRILETSRRGVPITNYGLAISKVQGVLERVVKPLGRTI